MRIYPSMDMDSASSVVLQALTQATSQDTAVLKPAEEQLRQWETQPGFYSVLLVSTQFKKCTLHVLWLAYGDALSQSPNFTFSSLPTDGSWLFTQLWFIVGSKRHKNCICSPLLCFYVSCLTLSRKMYVMAPGTVNQPGSRLKLHAS